jgi:hypothetical protein
MASATFTHVLAGPSRVAKSKGEALLHDQPSLNPAEEDIMAPSVPSKPFSIAQLPYELRQLIYMRFFSSLPTQDITCSNARLTHHSLTCLALSSPFLALDASKTLFYRNATFSFNCPEALKTFAKTIVSECHPEVSDRRNDIRKVKILYGRYDQPTRDWVYLLASNFEGLEEVTFSVDRVKEGFGIGHMCFGNWWGCVRDAVREGLVGDSKRKEVVLRVEDGEWGVVEVVRAYSIC